MTHPDQSPLPLSEVEEHLPLRTPYFKHSHLKGLYSGDVSSSFLRSTVRHGFADGLDSVTLHLPKKTPLRYDGDEPLPLLSFSGGDFDRPVGDVVSRLQYKEGTTEKGFELSKVYFPVGENVTRLHHLNAQHFSQADSAAAKYLIPAHHVRNLQPDGRFPADFAPTRHHDLCRVLDWLSMFELFLHFRTHPEVASDMSDWWVPCIHQRKKVLHSVYVRCKKKDGKDIGIAFARNLNTEHLERLLRRLKDEFDEFYLY